MTLLLILSLAVLLFAIIVLFVLWSHESWQANRFQNLFYSAQYQLGQVHDALSEIPKDATTPIGDIVFRIKRERLASRNEIWQIENILRVPALDSHKTSVEKIGFLLKMVQKAAQGDPIFNRDEDYR